MPRIKFYFDEHVPIALSNALRQRGVDTLTVRDAGRRGLSDSEQLAFAKSENRVMVTMDSDYIILAVEGFQHAGICYAKPGARSIGNLVRTLLLIHDVLDSEEMVNHIEFI